MFNAEGLQRFQVL